MNSILFHIPHSSLKIPKKYWTICIKNRDYILKTNKFLSDYFVDKLAPRKSNKLIFPYSRIFCDVEKFKDDAKEIMASKGMGVLYTKDCENVIAVINKNYKNKVIKSYYDKYHDMFNKTVTNLLNKYNKCLIIDLHSFSEEMVEKLFGAHDCPDICIGIDSYYTSNELLEFTKNFFINSGYSVKINYPYSGTIIPNKYINRKECRLQSIMIEINKKIYLQNSKDFYKLQECLNAYYLNLQKLNI